MERLHVRIAPLLRLWATTALVALTTACGAVQPGGGAPITDVVVAVNSMGPARSITRDDLGSIYLGRQQYWDDGTPIKPLMLPRTAPATSRFIEQVLQMGWSQFKQYWQSKQLSGRGLAPGNVRTPNELLRRVAASRGSIGFLAKTDADRMSHPRVRFVPIQ